MDRILIDNGRYETTLWFNDGFTVLKGNILENAEKIYNIATTKYVCEEDSSKHYVHQEFELYIDYYGLGQSLEQILTEKYKLKIDRCNVYRNHKDYNSDTQSVVTISKHDFNFQLSKGENYEIDKCRRFDKRPQKY